MHTARLVASMILFGGLGGIVPNAARATPLQQAASQPHPSANLLVGSIVSINGKSLTVKADSGVATTVTVSDTARILRSAPGAKTVAGATAIPLTDLAVGDRVLVALHPAPDGSGPMATTVVAMKQADIEKKQQADQEDWKLHGVGGIVKTVDASAGTLTVAAQTRTITVHTTPTTIIRRYDPASIRYADAKPSTLNQIHAGDQLRVRGTRSADGGEIQAEEIVASSFRNIAGTVISVDAAANTITVTDLVTKKPVVIHVTPDSQLHKLPAMMAQALAMRFKKAAGNGHGPQSAATTQTAAGKPQAASKPASANASTDSTTPRRNLSQILQRTPVIQVSDLHKGDAVMVVASQGTPGSVTAFTLVAGVEPILAASPGGSQNMFSASWNLNGQGGASADGAPPAGR